MMPGEGVLESSAKGPLSPSALTNYDGKALALAQVLFFVV